MQITLGKTGYVQIAGTIQSDTEFIQCKNGNYRCKASAVIGVQKDQQGNLLKDTQGRNVYVWVNLTAWGIYASVLGQAQKGDGIFAIGTVQQWEHNGKTYKSLVVNNDGFLSISYPMQPAGQPAAAEYQDAPQMSDITDDDDGELPF